jgi:hypothetical protein
MTVVDRSGCRTVSFAPAIRDDICTTVAITSAWIAITDTATSPPKPRNAAVGLGQKMVTSLV